MLEGVALYSSGVWGEEEMLQTEEQCAVSIMVNHAEISVPFGFNSPQAKCARNVCAANIAFAHSPSKARAPRDEHSRPVYFGPRIGSI